MSIWIMGIKKADQIFMRQFGSEILKKDLWSNKGCVFVRIRANNEQFEEREHVMRGNESSGDQAA